MKKLVGVLAVILLTGAGCPLFPSAEEPAEQVRDDEQETFFAIGSWTLVSVTRSGESPQDVSDIGSTLTLDADGQFSVVICNSMSGDYSIDNGGLEAPEVVSTLMFCTGVPGEVEAVFTQDLATGFQIEGEGDELVLHGDSGTSFTYVRSSGSEPSASADRSVEGTIVSVNLEGIAADGPAVVTIKTDAGTFEEIQVPSFGLLLCVASANIADVYTLESGDRVAVRGSVSGSAIVPCESSEHYLRVVAE